MAQNKLKILILDDEPIVCKRLKPSLEKHGFQVDTFTRSFEALQAVQETGYDIIITDLKMEGMDGMRFLQEAKKLNPSTGSHCHYRLCHHGDRQRIFQKRGI